MPEPPRRPAEGSRTVVIGVGSPLMGDDGVGLAALEALRESWSFDPPVELVDGGTWSMNVLHEIEDADRLLLLDAIRAGRPAGELVVLERDELPRFFSTKLSPHQIDLREALALAELRGSLPEDDRGDGPRAGAGRAPGRASEEIAPRLAGLVEQVVKRIESWGHRARRR